MAKTTIHSDYIPDNAITSTKIAENSIGAREIATNAITTLYVADGSVSSEKLASNIDIAGTFDVTGATTLDSTLSVSGNITGTLATAAQPNITSVGTLTGLNVNVGTNNVGATFTSTDQEVLLALDDSLKTTTIESNNGILIFGTNGASGGTSATEAMRIDRNQLVTCQAGIDVTGTVTADGLTVNSSEVLFDNTGGDFTLKLNTNAVGDKNEVIMGDSGTPLAKFGVGGTADDIITGSDGQDFNIGTAGGGRAINFSTDNFASVEMKLDGGNLGIGASSALDNKLEVNGGDIRVRGTSTPSIKFNNADQEVVGMRLKSGASGVLSFHTDKMVIDTSGNVGIGTSSVSASRMQIKGANNSTTAYADGLKVTSNNETVYMQYSWTGMNANDSMKFGIAGSEKMRLDSSGSLVLQDDAVYTTNAPTHRGSLILSGASGSTSFGGIEFHTNAGGGAGYGTKIAASDAEQAFLRRNNSASWSESMRIRWNGEVLIGNTDLSGGLINMRASSSKPSIETRNDSTGTIHYALFFRNNAGTQIGYVKISNTGTEYNTVSDYRLKENIQPLENGLQRLSQLNPVQFDWKEDGTSSEGFIAHEVQEIFPDAVSHEKDGEQMQGMDYGRITPLLVKAIQEQQTQIEALQSEINLLKGE